MKFYEELGEFLIQAAVDSMEVPEKGRLGKMAAAAVLVVPGSHPLFQLPSLVRNTFQSCKRSQEELNK